MTMSGHPLDDRGARLPSDEDGAEDIEILEVIGIDEDGAAIADREADAVADAEAAETDDSDIEVIFDAEDDSAEPQTPRPSPRDEGEQLRERILRLTADFENFRYRMERDRGEHLRFATFELVGRILPVLDNFDRAMASVRPGSSDDALLAGFALIQRQLLAVLEAEGLRAMGGVGETFDPSRHEAVATDSESPLPAHAVTQVFQRGYFLHDRVLRPALVRVRLNAPEREPGEDDGKEIGHG
jgi:molecular chaperone GrpE